MKIPHWLRCRWTHWTQYEREYGAMDSNPNTVLGVYRTAIREWRICEVCKKYQDREVVRNASLQKEKR